MFECLGKWKRVLNLLTSCDVLVEVRNTSEHESNLKYIKVLYQFFIVIKETNM